MNTIGLVAAQQRTQTASPRLQQAVRLLQMSSLEFVASMKSALGTNPFPEAEDSAEDIEGQSAEVCVPNGSETSAEGNDAGILGLVREDRDLCNADLGSATSHRLADDSDISVLDQMLLNTSLATHLCAQLYLMPLPTRDMALDFGVAASLDDDGYLRLPLDEVLEGMGLDLAPDEDEKRIALRRVQALDPPSVGARDVRGCFMLQLSALLRPVQRALAVVIVGEHVDALATRDVVRLSRLLGAAPLQV